LHHFQDFSQHLLGFQRCQGFRFLCIGAGFVHFGHGLFGLGGLFLHLGLLNGLLQLLHHLTGFVLRSGVLLHFVFGGDGAWQVHLFSNGFQQLAAPFLANDRQIGWVVGHLQELGTHIVRLLTNQHGR